MIELLSRQELASASQYAREFDSFTIIPHQGHFLWESVVLPHVSCRAAWREYRTVLEGVPQEDWLRDYGGKVLLWFGAQNWKAYQDAIDKLYLQMRREQVSPLGATVSYPVLMRRGGDSDADEAFLRGRTCLCVYVRIDYRDDATCSIGFGDEKGQEAEIAIAPGDMVLVSGFRKHRIRGCCDLVHLGVDIPSLARRDALQNQGLRDPRVEDAVVFAAATAQPLSVPLPSAELLTEKLEWLNARSQRQHRHEVCDAVRRFLVENIDPAEATEQDMTTIRSLGKTTQDIVEKGHEAVQVVPVLSEQECATLRQFADDHMTSVTPDTVDDLPEYQLNLTPEMLNNLLGAETAESLLRLPSKLGEREDLALEELYEQIDIFIRIYSSEMRRYIAFHSDNCSWTANIALNEEREFEGGRLLALYGGRLVATPRACGSATLHPSNLIHGVSRMIRGKRYSLILFFHKKQL